MKYQMDDLDVRYFESALMVISICCHFVVLSCTVNTKTQREEQLHIRPHNYSWREKVGRREVGRVPGLAMLPETRHLIVLALVCPMSIPLSILAAHLHWIRYIAWHLELTFLRICAEEVCASAVMFWLSIRFHSCNDSENLCTSTDPIFWLIWR